MPDEYEDDYEDFEDGTNQAGETALIKQLRKQVRDQSRQLKELTERDATNQKALRERAVADVLTERGINPKVAKFIPGDIETTPDAIKGWLDDYADVFGIKVEAEQEVPPAPEQQAAYERMRAVEDGGRTAQGSDALQQKLAAAGSRDELMSLIAQYGKG